MIQDQLPDIPRLYTAIAEWSACFLYILLASKQANIRKWISIIGALPLIIGWQLLAGTFPTWAWVAGMVIAALLMCVAIAAGTGQDFFTSLFLFARAFVLAELVASLHWQLYAYAIQFADVFPLLSPVSMVLIYGAAFLGVFFLERRHFPKDQVIDVSGSALTMSLAIAALTFLISNLSFFSPNTPFSGRQGAEIFYIRTLVDLAGLVALYAQQGQRLESQRAMELNATTILLNAQHEQYLQSQRNIDQVNRKYHDLKHYIAAIRAESSEERRSTFLDQLEDSIRGYEYEVNTGNPVLNAILGPKLARCSELGINVTCVVDGEALEFMDAMRLSALFGNALDNAIESVSKVPKEQRLIKITAYRRDSFVLVRIENHYKGDVDIVDGLPSTTKSDTLAHGYGTKNMRSAVEAYGGSLTLRAQDDWFTMLALLPAHYS